jgi:hypothetical protein
MTEEEKKAETAKLAAEAKAKEDKDKADAEFEDSLADLSDEEKEAKRSEREASHNDNKPDYDAELKAERERREKAEAALAEKRFKASERKRKGEVVDDEPPADDEDEDRPLTKKDLASILETERQATIRETQAGRIESIAKELTENPKEAELIVEIHKNRTWPSSIPLREQLEEAHAIANRKRLQSKNKELARAVASKDGVSKDIGGGHRDPLPGSAPKMSSSDEASYKRAGFEYDSAKKLWKKKLPTGKFLYKDARTKKTYVG